MADELRHETTATAGGLALAKTDWEDVDSHRFDSQAQGDMMIATSATQLSRLGAGATAGDVLITGGAGANPSWSPALNVTNLNVTNDGTKTTLATVAGDYWRIGDAATTSHALASEDDLMVTGKLEVYGLIYPDGGFNLGSGSTNFTTSGGGAGVTIRSTNDGSRGSILNFEQDSASPNAGDDVGIIYFRGESSTSVKRIYVEIDGSIIDATNAAEEGELNWLIINGGAQNLAMKLSGAGGLSVDANISTGDDPVALFDGYDDALMLKQGVQQRNHELLVDMGIFSRKETGSGYTMNIQPMTRLLAGGIYQNREMIEQTAEMLLSKIEGLEQKLEQLKGG